MRRIVLCALAAVLLAVPRTQAAGKGGRSSFDILRGKYESAQAGIDRTFAKQQSDVSVSYGKALVNCMASLQRKGELDSFLVLEKEEARFVAEQTIPPAEGCEDPYIKEAVARHDAMLAKAAAEKKEKTVRLGQQYLARLKSLIRDLMQADRIRDAKVVQQEIKRVEFLVSVLLGDGLGEKRLQGAGTNAGPSPAVAATPKYETSITLSGVGFGAPKWKPTTVRVKKGQVLTLQAEPLSSLATVGATADSFRIRIGLNGNEYRFSDKGLYVYTQGRSRRKYYKPVLSYKADVDGSLCYYARQKMRFRVRVTVE